MSFDKEEIVVKIIGGLGNQMFQFAFGQKLKKTFGVNVGYDILDFEIYNLRNFELQNFNIEIDLADNLRSKKFRFSKRPLINYIINKVLLGRENYFYEPKIDVNTISLQNENYFWGYWQLSNFYDDILPSLREHFDLKSKLSLKSAEYNDLIKYSKSVSIHIRKSDYLLKKNNYFASCNVKYYKEAIEFFNSKIDNPTYFVFSDDFEWVESNMTLYGPQYVFVKSNSVNSTVEDFVLMKSCKHQIIANSTYSWWAAYLNAFEEKTVICPEKWFNNSDKTLNRNEWIKLKNE